MGDAAALGKLDNWCTHRDMDSVQESGRCKQTKPSLWPARLAGGSRDHSPVARAGLSPGLAWYAPRAIGTRSQAEEATVTDSEPRSEGSPGRDHPNRRQCPERGTPPAPPRRIRTTPEGTHGKRAHRPQHRSGTSPPCPGVATPGGSLAGRRMRHTRSDRTRFGDGRNRRRSPPARPRIQGPRSKGKETKGQRIGGPRAHNRRHRAAEEDRARKREEDRSWRT